MTTTLMVFQAFISFFLIGMVLIQFGKGAEAGLFSGTSDSVFTGAQQGNILSKITVVLAVLFLGNSILLAKMQSRKADESLLKGSAPIAIPLNRDKEAAAAESKAGPTPAPTPK